MCISCAVLVSGLAAWRMTYSVAVDATCGDCVVLPAARRMTADDRPQAIFPKLLRLWSSRCTILGSQDRILVSQDGILVSQDCILASQDGILASQDGMFVFSGFVSYLFHDFFRAWLLLLPNFF